MADDASLTVLHSAFVWRCSKTYEERSPTFKLQQRSFRLVFYSGPNEQSDYRLRIYNKEDPPTPFELSLYLIIGGNSVSHSIVTIKETGYKIIWKSTKSDLLKIAPDYEKEPFVFKIVLYGNAAHSEEKTGHKSVQTPIYLDPAFQLEKLSKDFAMLLDGHHSSDDVEVVCGNRTWTAQRSVLGCRSDVLRTMLQSDMLEGRTGRVQVQDTDDGLFEQFLHHLHTGKLLELTVDTAMRLYEMGDKYNVEGLKEQCGSYLVENLAHENACRILSLADRHCDQDLKEIATAYVVEQKIPLRENHWSSFCRDNPALALAVVNRFLSCM